MIDINNNKVLFTIMLVMFSIIMIFSYSLYSFQSSKLLLSELTTRHYVSNVMDNIDKEYIKLLDNLRENTRKEYDEILLITKSQNQKNEVFGSFMDYQIEKNKHIDEFVKSQIQLDQKIITFLQSGIGTGN